VVAALEAAKGGNARQFSSYERHTWLVELGGFVDNTQQREQAKKGSSIRRP